MAYKEKLISIFSKSLYFIKDSYLNVGYVSRAIFQSIIVIALLIALQDNPPEPLNIIIILVVSVLTIQASRVYANLIAKKIEKGSSINFIKNRELIEEIWDFSKGVSIPVIVFIIAWMGLISVHIAFVISKIALLCILFIYGFLGGKMSGSNLLMSIFQGIVVLIGGSILVILKAFLN